MKVPELLAPAGTPEKLQVALHYGADAVYVGLKRLSLRRHAGNFSWDELEWALGYAHERGRRVYVAVNLQPFDTDFPDVEDTLRTLERLRPDGVIVADGGVLAAARELAPHVPVHLSTQTSVTNAPGARFWFRSGVERICVARELTLAQLRGVAAGAGGEIECFVHGAVCVAWSGRCFSSLYWAGRDPRRGECAQACRWSYRLLEDRRRPGEGNPVETDEDGTHFFDAKDLCALPVLEELVATGVVALKIEGRTRSEHYVGSVVDVYRDALDRLAAGDAGGFRSRQGAYLAELQRPTNRGFSLHFLGGGMPGPDAYNLQGSQPARENDYVGRLRRRTPEWVELELRNPVRRGDRLEVRSRGLRSHALAVDVLATPDGSPLEAGRPGQVVRVPGCLDVEEGALVRVALPG